ncbi:MAG: hypothetical protein HQ490_05685, partial [Lutibacter sp.]|nr:hypothetical protein [Lutibacter sp.]
MADILFIVPDTRNLNEEVLQREIESLKVVAPYAFLTMGSILEEAGF